MTAEELTRITAQVGFVVLFGISLLRAVRSPRPSNRNAAAFFGCVAFLIFMQWGTALLGGEDSELAADLAAGFILLFPYLLLRLAPDFLGVKRWLIRPAPAAALAAGACQ